MSLFKAVATGNLKNEKISINKNSASTVVLVAGGYPEAYEKGKSVTIGDLNERSLVFHAGTKKENDTTLTNGGRVISVTSYGKDIESSVKNSYESIENISFEKMSFRKDIGMDLVNKA